jgi:hypothetical protein
MVINKGTHKSIRRDEVKQRSRNEIMQLVGEGVEKEGGERG